MEVQSLRLCPFPFKLLAETAGFPPSFFILHYSFFIKKAAEAVGEMLAEKGKIENEW